MRARQIAALFTRLCYYLVIIFSLWAVPSTGMFSYYLFLVFVVWSIVNIALGVRQIIAGDWDLWRSNGAWGIWDKLGIFVLMLYTITDAVEHIYWAAVLGIICLMVIGLMYPAEPARTTFEGATQSIYGKTQKTYFKRVK